MIYLMHPPELYRKKDSIVQAFDDPRVTLGEINPEDIWTQAWQGKGDLWTDDYGRGYMFGYIVGERYTIQNCSGG